ncbi:MAG: OB-fold nucleic acid binding domain-containing protein [Elainellaceae cyanobacterium]
MKKSLAFSLVAALVAVGIPAKAQIPIRYLHRDPGVTIAGEIRSVVGNEFILDDGTGQVIVDGGPIWYHQLNLQEGEQVTVVGEYDDYDFDAFSITRGSGEVIRIRDAEGPPPWAGRRRRN